jgi:hypothetical protein
MSLQITLTGLTEKGIFIVVKISVETIGLSACARSLYGCGIVDIIPKRTWNNEHIRKIGT